LKCQSNLYAGIDIEILTVFFELICYDIFQFVRRFLMKDRVKLGISSCILGEKVRYDGQHKLDPYLKVTIGQFVKWVPVCPEVDCGLPVPREAMRLVGDPESPRLVTQRTGIDYTDRMLRWSRAELRRLGKEGLCGFVFKSKSPSSGLSRVKVYGASGMPGKTGRGLFAKAFVDHFPLLPVEDDGRLHDPRLRENFIERVFVFKRWRELEEKRRTLKGLIDFHSDHKASIMAHSTKHLRTLGQMVAQAKQKDLRQVYEDYLGTLMQGLQLLATVKKNVNVLQHLMGYFKKQLTSDEKQELLDVIGQYHRELIPLIVPVTLIRHYVRKYQEPYLLRQVYLHPHPVELMLRNHV
jgi:uncharacterized protein YbgA (DUF1722 family)/uncharacterized protein YbbK (DUF523 family)